MDKKTKEAYEQGYKHGTEYGYRYAAEKVLEVFGIKLEIQGEDKQDEFIPKPTKK